MSPLVLMTIVGTFAAIAVAAGTATYAVLERQAPGRKRLQAIVAGSSRAAAAVPAALAPISLTDKPSARTERIASVLPKSPAEMNRLRRRLVRAGYHSLKSALVYSIAELTLPIVLGAPAMLLVAWPQSLIIALAFAFLGYLLPSFILGKLIEQRRLALTNALPDTLDLLIVCLEAGCALDQAIVKASDELALAYPALAEELKMLSTETRAGKPRIEAFRNLEARTKNDDIRSLVAMLVQTDRFGTSVSQALRTFAEVARTKRRQRAEEKAAKIGVKMVFPLVLCLFPALYVVILGGAVVQMVHSFSQIGNR